MTEKLCLLPSRGNVAYAGGVSRALAPAVASRKFRSTGALPPQGYRISLSPDDGEVTNHRGATTPGAFYAQQTLAQLRRQFGDSRCRTARSRTGRTFPCAA